MALGQHLLVDDDYREMIRNLSYKAFVIVDNGAAEHDQPKFRELVDVANYVNADEIVMPDVLGDRETTISQIMAARNSGLVEPHRQLITPQGESVDEWIDCCEYFKQHAFPFATLGIPKHLERLPGGRTEAVKRLRGPQRFNLHLFGVYKHLAREVLGAYNSLSIGWHIRGIDTGAAVAFAQANKDPFGGEHASLQWVAPTGVAQTDRALDNMGYLEEYVYSM